MCAWLWRLGRYASLLFLGAGMYHGLIFFAGPWWMAYQETPTHSMPAVSVSAAFEAQDVLTVDVESADTKQWWNVLWYALRADRPRERAVLVPGEGGPGVHSLYLLDSGRGHRIVVRGLEIQFQPVPGSHLAVR